MTDDRLAVILMDALGPSNIYDHQLFEGFEWIRSAYKRNGDVLGVSTLPHTAQSNPMIWGGFINADKFWVEPKDADEWIDPAVLFEHRGQEHNRDDAAEYRNYDRADFDQSFVWDVLDAAGVDATALQVPICLPPYSYNVVDLDPESWFPDTEDRMRDHVRVKPELIRQHALGDGHDFIATSIQMPDKWLHGIPEGKCDREFVREEAHEVDYQLEKTIRVLESEGYDWVVAGDHGSPCPGAMPVRAARTVLPRHRKEAVIFGSEDLDLPTYTSEIYPWILERFGVEDREVDPDLSKSVPSIPPEFDADVTERLENLGYL
jgi:hypothetical protein